MGVMLERPETGTIPTSPGAYLFKDAQGRVVYAGKATNLRSRLSNYFAPAAQLPERTHQMMAVAETVEWIEVRNEGEVRPPPPPGPPVPLRPHREVRGAVCRRREP